MLEASLLCLTALGCRVQGLQNKAGHFLLSALQAGIHAGQLCSQQHQDTLCQVQLLSPGLCTKSALVCVFLVPELWGLYVSISECASDMLSRRKGNPSSLGCQMLHPGANHAQQAGNQASQLCYQSHQGYLCQALRPSQHLASHSSGTHIPIMVHNGLDSGVTERWGPPASRTNGGGTSMCFSCQAGSCLHAEEDRWFLQHNGSGPAHCNNM